MFCFTSVLLVCLLAYQKALLTQAASDIAQRASLADVLDEDFDVITQNVFGRFGLVGATASGSISGQLFTVESSCAGLLGIELRAVSFAALEA